jgi:hypothetical protein
MFLFFITACKIFTLILVAFLPFIVLSLCGISKALDRFLSGSFMMCVCFTMFAVCGLVGPLIARIYLVPLATVYTYPTISSQNSLSADCHLLPLPLPTLHSVLS